MQVSIRLLTGLLLGNVWYRAGETATIDEQRAKRLVSRRKAEILGPAVADGQQHQPDRQSAVADGQQYQPDRPAAGDLLSNPDVVGAGPIKRSDQPKKSQQGTPLADVGIAGKTAQLLAEQGLTSVESVRTKIADGFDLTEIDGIGKATAKTILAALATGE